MTPDAPFNEFHVEWEATATWDSDDGGRAVVWKLGDDFDPDAFVATRDPEHLSLPRGVAACPAPVPSASAVPGFENDGGGPACCLPEG
ncbi:hypothetical protein [Nocardioides panacisoli]|uniref:Uncharacterized protein n=1 Tax=Nocardioides panacisoli TaxID=627624 RepID=A0ABP7HX76_9ACTN